MKALQQSIAAGQYEYPSGIFYGGSKPSRSMEVIRENCEQWIGSTQKVIHVDFHSGLGAFGEHKLLLAQHADSRKCHWYRRVFGHESVEARDDAASTSYSATGTMGQWLQQHCANRDHRFVTAEFGTYSPIRVLAAIRAENCAHRFANEQSPVYRKRQTRTFGVLLPG